jgi:hypothetical protein
MRLQILFVFVQIIIHSSSRNIFFLKSLYLLFCIIVSELEIISFVVCQIVHFKESMPSYDVQYKR